MCIIIQKPANKTIPFIHLETSIKNNPHGWGLMTADGHGRHMTIRDVNKPSPEALARLVNDELSDKEVMLHLRYNTKGETCLRNAHPFPVLWEKTDGEELRMFHNGTIFSYGPKTTESKDTSWESDTRRFVRTFVRPLFLRMNHGTAREILEDKFITGLLDEELGFNSKSVLAFMTGKGESFFVNKGANDGCIWDGVYYSNTYSLDPGHRDISYTQTNRITSKTPVTTPPEATDPKFDEWAVCDYAEIEKMSDFLKHTKDMSKVELMREMKKLRDLAVWWYDAYWQDYDETVSFPADSSRDSRVLDKGKRV